ncbi:MAG TPA: ATP-dependent DNA ligase [Dongiaceae bacterium]|nr:ATP-dependent DNA ligase [Dongiaceae bacterium]
MGRAASFALPVEPPIEPMLALLTRDFPASGDWTYEFKYDGFRAIVFWDGKQLLLQSRDRRPLNRYFPELEAGLRDVLPAKAVLDGEIVIETPSGFDFEALLLRIHPAVSRVTRLARETPASFIAFDLLATGRSSLLEQPFRERRSRLVAMLESPRLPLRLTPATSDQKVAKKWFRELEGAGIDGVMAKDPASLYVPGERVMRKIKHERTADCVVGGFRWSKDHAGKAIGSLLLGLYEGKVLHYVGHASNFKAPERKALVAFLDPYRKNVKGSFGEGRAPGGPSRWSRDMDKSWEPVRPELVCEVAYDHMQGDRFRHAARFMRWRPDKPPKDCRYDQLREAKPMNPRVLFRQPITR